MVLVVKSLPDNAGKRDVGSIPVSGRSPGGGNGDPLQHSCLKNPMNRGDWRAMVHWVAKSGTQPKRLSAHTREVRLWQKLSEFCFTDQKRRVEDFLHVYACMRVCLIVSCLATRWTIAHQAPMSVGFSRQDYWGGLPFPSPGDLPHPGIEPASPVPPALAGGFFTTGTPGKTFHTFTGHHLYFLYSDLFFFLPACVILPLESSFFPKWKFLNTCWDS